MTDDELIGRIANTLRRDIAPSVDDEYAKTQAYMAAVVLERIARELAHEDEHRAQRSAERAALADDLRRLVNDGPREPAVDAALDAFARDADDVTLCALVTALHDARGALGTEHAEALLARVRRTMRADVDRRMVIAG